VPRGWVGGAISWLLMAAGLALFGGSVGMLALGRFQEATYRQPGVRAPWQPAPLVAAPPEVPAGAPVPQHGESAALNATESPAAMGAEAAAAAVEAPLPRSPRRLRIPSIGVDSPVVELGFTDKGEWELPNEEVGWYRHTAPPSAAGNAVLVGHLNSPWGLPRVFARLKDVRVGDVVEVESGGRRGANPAAALRRGRDAGRAEHGRRDHGPDRG
jgi:hypothetical protein